MRSKEQKFVIGNWKMNPVSLKRAREIFKKVKKGVEGVENTKVVICPPFLYLNDLKVEGSNLELGGQNCFWEDQGAYTGEVSPSMLKHAGCKYVITGHSEREKYLKEEVSMTAKKVEAVLRSDLIPVVCIGDKDKSPADDRLVKEQVKEIVPDEKGVILVYEPVWAISTEGGLVPSEKEAKKGRELVLQGLKTKKATILYGGSVDSKNVLSYLKAGFDGVLVGGASLNPREFVKIVQIVEGAAS